MRVPLALGLIVLTSVLGYAYGKWALQLSSHGFSVAWKITLECVWLGVVFFAVNLLVASTGILVSRVAVGQFLSLYAADDITIVVLSFLQGACFQLWRRQAQRGETT